MKNILSCKKTSIILLIITIISIGLYTYMIARPVSFGMAYHNETEYEGGVFEGTMKFNSDGTMVNKNTNFEEEMKSFYYYKDGYVFYTTAGTNVDYETEVAKINENFDEAIKRDIIVGLLWYSREYAYFPLLNWLIFLVCGYAFRGIWQRIQDKKRFFRLVTPISWVICVVYFASMAFFRGTQTHVCIF